MLGLESHSPFYLCSLKTLINSHFGIIVILSIYFEPIDYTFVRLDNGGACFLRVCPLNNFARNDTSYDLLNNFALARQLDLVEGKQCQVERKKKRKRRVDYVLTMEQLRSGTHFPRIRPPK
jgi:hypothetical protein